MAQSSPSAAATCSRVACVDEPSCIGCTLCIEACPVDAIVGAQGWMHTVIASQCTGCRWCVPACPVDCITMVPAPAEVCDAETRRERSALYRRRHLARRARRELAESEIVLDARSRQDAVERAIQRARRRLENGKR